jgi:PAS domain S-box-containing protein
MLALGAGLGDGLLLRLDAEGRCREVRGPGLAGFDLAGDGLAEHLVGRTPVAALPAAVAGAVADALAGRVAGDPRLHVQVTPDGASAGWWVLVRDRAAVAPDAVLRARETRFRALVEHGADGVMLLDARGKVLFQGPVQLFGYSPDALLGQDGFSYIHPADRPKVQAAFARLIANPGGQEQTEYRFRDRLGRWRYVGVTATNRLHDPALAAVVVNYRDVDERRRADDALRLLFIDAVPGADFFPLAARHLAVALEVRAVFLSAIVGPHLQQLAAAGLPASTPPGSPAERPVVVGADADSGDEPRAIDLVLPAQELAGSAAEAALDHPGTEPLRVFGGARARFPGDRRLADLDAESYGALVLRDGDGTALGVIEIATDRVVVSTPRLARLFALVAARAAAELVRRRAEAAREASEELNRLILEAIPGGIFHVSADGLIRHVNNSALRFLGRTREETIGMHVGASAARTVREDGSPFPASEYPVVRCLATGTVQPSAIIGVRRADGTMVWGLFNAVPLVDPAGLEAPGAVVMFIDVTERKQLEDRLTQAHKLDAVGKLAGGVAHDFNNLLCVILGRLDRVIERLPPADPLRQDLLLANRTAVRATALTRQLLAVSRQQAAAPRVVDLNAVVAGMGELLAGLAGERVALRILAGEQLGMVRADPNQLEQVIVNLAVNARDAMPQGGTLTIQTSNAEVRGGNDGLDPGAYVLLAVKDTGTGIDPAIRARIFEPFFTTKGVGQGTGLGLALVAEIVSRAGGRVTLASEPGRGSMFLVYLPRGDGQAGGSTSVALHRIRPGRGRETVLLVEDHVDVRELLAAQLTGLGYVLLTAGSGEEALERAGRHPGPIHLLVTDMVMPGIGGRELAQRLGGRPRPKVLYISGYTSEDMASTLAPGQAFLQKPFSGAVLAQKVRDLLDGVEG